MKKSIQKPISNLDLKLLDVKFIAIDDNQFYRTQALQSVRRAKLIQLPSLLMSKDKSNSKVNQTFNADDSRIITDYKQRSTVQSISQFDQSILSNKFRSSQFSCLQQPPNKPSQVKSLFGRNQNHQTNKNQIQLIQQQVRQRSLLKKKNQNQTRTIPSIYCQNSQKASQQAELQKYRKKIQLIKKQNLLIHKQISSLYRNKINQNKQPLKKIRKIQPFKQNIQDITEKVKSSIQQQQKLNRNFSVMKKSWDIQKIMKNTILSQNNPAETETPLQKKLASSPLIREKVNFYENLGQKSPYKQQLENIHKKIISNNIHKNFEQYLIGTGKRVPQFIKKLRN